MVDDYLALYRRVVEIADKIPAERRAKGVGVGS